MVWSRRTRLVLGTAAAAGIAAALSGVGRRRGRSSGARRSQRRPKGTTPCALKIDQLPSKQPGPWVDADAPRRIRQLVAPIEAELGWPGLGDYLVAIAWIESRGNSQAGSSANTNDARGWFGERPDSAELDELGLSVAALKDEPTSVGLVTDYIYRLRKHADPGQVVDWLALRRGHANWWRVPHVNSDHSCEQLARGLVAAGLDPSFMLQPAFGPDFHWPGREAVLQIVGAGAYA